MAGIWNRHYKAANMFANNTFQDITQYLNNYYLLIIEDTYTNFNNKKYFLVAAIFEIMHDNSIECLNFKKIQ